MLDALADGFALWLLCAAFAMPLAVLAGAYKREPRP